jgi:N-acetyl-alpha-D-muramate 1-phosphate uridylyltransferase
MKAMLLAAGRGERMHPLTDAVPKPLLRAGGQPLIVWQLQRLAACGIQEVIINCSWLAEQLPAALGTGERWGLSIHYSFEPYPALETGGGIFQALPMLGPEPFLLVNGDIYTDIDYAALRLPPSALAQLVLVPNPEHHPRGDFDLQGERLTYSGVALIDPQLFAGCEAGRFALAPLLFKARDAGQLSLQKHSGYWLDVGTPQRLAQLDAHLQLCQHPAHD